LSHGQKVVYWLIDFIIPNFASKFGREEFEGKILIASRQLWSLMSESLVRSAFIGPGYIKGVIKKTSGAIEFEQPISSVIFDPTELRRTEPLPLVNIFSPEVIDPLAESSKEEIESLVRKIIITRGKPLVQEKIAEVKPLTSIPTLEHISMATVKLEIQLTSGASRAKFALKGVHKKIYAPYSSILSSARSEYDDPSKLSIFWVDKRQLVPPSRGNLSEWMIIEQSAERTEADETPKDGYDKIFEEYRRTLEFMKTNSKSYLLA
jgi:hypothetical protein